MKGFCLITPGFALIDIYWRLSKDLQFANLELIRKLKGYLRSKTITSQNVSSEAQVKNFFIS